MLHATRMMGWAAWLTAIGTVGAFAVALVLLALQQRDQRQTRRLAQARLVAAWVDEIRGPQSDPSILAYPGLLIFDCIVLVHNESREPVYRVMLKLDVGVRGAFVRDTGVLGPSETREYRFEIPGSPHGTPAFDLAFQGCGGEVVAPTRNGREVVHRGRA
jgi:hypothetical protein